MPKGCVHEYGDIDLLIMKVSEGAGSNYPYSDMRIALSTALYDISTIMVSIRSLYFDSYIYVVEKAACSLTEAYAAAIKENCLTVAIGMPHVTDMKLLSTLPSLKLIYVSFDIINDVYIPGIAIYNSYGMSESVVSVALFLIDGNYDITPVGRPNPFRKTVLLDDNDNPVKHGQIGEVAFHNPYFRGYINKPELTAYAKRNGIYHTGDMGYFDANGNLVIVGRKSNIIETDDGFIVPEFTKVELKKLYNGSIEVIASKIDNNNYLCAFYIEDEADGVDFEYLTSKLSESLPERQLPTHYVPLKSFPRFVSGKLNRNKLKMILDSYLDVEMCQ